MDKRIRDNLKALKDRYSQRLEGRQEGRIAAGRFLAQFARLRDETILPAMEEFGVFMKPMHSFKVKSSDGKKPEQKRVSFSFFVGQPEAPKTDWPSLSFVAYTHGEEVEVTDDLSFEKPLARMQLSDISREVVEEQLRAFLRRCFDDSETPKIEPGRQFNV